MKSIICVIDTLLTRKEKRIIENKRIFIITPGPKNFLFFSTFKSEYVNKSTIRNSMINCKMDSLKPSSSKAPFIKLNMNIKDIK